MIEIKQLGKSEIEIIGEMPAEEFSRFWPKAVEELAKNVSLPGFRPGKVPEKILIEKLGENEVLERAADLALRDVYVKIIQEKKIEAIGVPRATVTKLAKNSPLGFKFQTAVLPDFSLPEGYAVLAKEVFSKKEEITAEEKEIDDSIEYLRKARAAGEGKELPELNDEFAKAVGKFATLEELRDAIRKNIQFEKEMKFKEKQRLEALEEILKKTKMEIPDVLVEAEKQKMLSSLKNNISGAGLKWEDYLKHIKKEDKDILGGFSEDAVKRIKYGLLLDKLAADLKIEVSEKETEDEIKKFGNGGAVDREKLKDYAYGIIRSEKIFNLLGKD